MKYAANVPSEWAWDNSGLWIKYIVNQTPNVGLSTEILCHVVYSIATLPMNKSLYHKHFIIRFFNDLGIAAQVQLCISATEILNSLHSGFWFNPTIKDWWQPVKHYGSRQSNAFWNYEQLHCLFTSQRDSKMEILFMRWRHYICIKYPWYRSSNIYVLWNPLQVYVVKTHPVLQS